MYLVFANFTELRSSMECGITVQSFTVYCKVNNRPHINVADFEEGLAETNR